jgi:hypothetical protein
MKHYIVYSKGDDYGACKTELVFTQEHLAEEYYHHKVVPEQDVETLERYLDFVTYEEEVERTENQRFYGGDE